MSGAWGPEVHPIIGALWDELDVGYVAPDEVVDGLREVVASIDDPEERFDAVLCVLLFVDHVHEEGFSDAADRIRRIADGDPEAHAHWRRVFAAKATHDAEVAAEQLAPSAAKDFENRNAGAGINAMLAIRAGR